MPEITPLIPEDQIEFLMIRRKSLNFLVYSKVKHAESP